MRTRYAAGRSSVVLPRLSGGHCDHVAPSFSELSRDDVERELAGLGQEIGARQDELARRDVERRRQELEAELAALGEKESPASAAV